MKRSRINSIVSLIWFDTLFISFSKYDIKSIQYYGKRFGIKL